MSSVSSSLSAGAQLLANDNLLPSNLSQGQLASATPEQLAKTAGATLALETSSALFGGSASAGGDTVEFSPEAMSLLQQMGHFADASASTSTALTAYSGTAGFDSFDLLA